MMRAANRARGMTLVELVIAIVVVGICIVSVLGLLSSLSMRSAQAMMRTQASSIAASYLDEILSKAYQGPTTEVVRQTFDDVLDYNGLDDAGARNVNGALLAGLGQYRVQVRVTDDALGAGANATAARRIDVTVTDPTGTTTLLTGYRTSYAGQVAY